MNNQFCTSPVIVHDELNYRSFYLNFFLSLCAQYLGGLFGAANAGTAVPLESDKLLMFADLQSPIGFWELDEKVAENLDMSVNQIEVTCPSTCRLLKKQIVVYFTCLMVPVGRIVFFCCCLLIEFFAGSFILL